MYCGEPVVPAPRVTMAPWNLPGEIPDEDEAWFSDLATLARVLCAAGEQSIALWGEHAPADLVDRLKGDLARVQLAIDTGDEDDLAEALDELERGWSRLSDAP
jgi:hypothetical protein